MSKHVIGSVRLTEYQREYFDRRQRRIDTAIALISAAALLGCFGFVAYVLSY